MEEKDRKMLEEVKAISDHGNHAEVKKDQYGNWIVYEVKKKRKKVG